MRTKELFYKMSKAPRKLADDKISPGSAFHSAIICEIKDYLNIFVHAKISMSECWW